MDFDQLHAFLEIVRLKSFSKAARSCFRTQPAISAQIRQVEQELDTQLFERFGNRISLTAAGKIFADYAQKILDTKRAAFDAVRELERVPRGEVMIAANEATCVNVLPRVFSTYKSKFPHVQLQVIRSYGSTIVEAVLDNSVDFGITHLPVRERRLQTAQIHIDEIRLLTPPSHPLAELESVSAEQIVKYPLLLPKRGRTRTRIDEYLDLYDDKMDVSMELESSEMIKQFIIAGLGVGFMAVTNAKSEIGRGALVAVPLAPLPMIRTLGLIYRKDKAFSRPALGFIQVVSEFAAEEPVVVETALRGPRKATRVS
jgi:DNA-binding transcriptional LysR family regulator